MTATARKSAPVSNLDEHRLRKLLSEREQSRQRLTAAEQKLAAFCREWSFANGWRVPLKPEQVARAIEAEKGEGR